jgi:hypothetical protein
MKLNTTVVYTFSLLVLMISVGLVSAFSGFAIGREALKGITQPDSRPNQGKKADAKSDQQGEIVLLNEQEIIQTVQQRLNATGKSTKPNKPSPATKPDKSS